MTKSITEVSILRAMTAATESLGRNTDEAAWTKIAQLHSSLAVLDDRSIALIKRQNPALTGEELSRLLHEKVYAELFLTPDSDPWLGLFSTDVYTALDNGGIVNRK